MTPFFLLDDDLDAAERRDLFAAFIDTSLDAIICIDGDGHVMEWNLAAIELFGHEREHAVGTRLDALIVPPEMVAAHQAGTARFRQTGEPKVVGRRVELEAVDIAGRRFPVELTISPLRFRDRLCFVGRLRDISDRKRHESQLQLVAKELDHRVKNTLAIVLSLARQTILASSDLDDFGPTFEDRIIAYKRTHEMLGLTQYKGVDLHELLLSSFEPYRDHHGIDLGGPDVFVPSRAAVTLGMIVHEMTTNAVKYGALSATGGAIRVSWTYDDDLEIDWIESRAADTTPVTELPAPRQGFGSRLIETGLKFDLKGSMTFHHAASGLEAHMRVPRSAMA